MGPTPAAASGAPESGAACGRAESIASTATSAERSAARRAGGQALAIGFSQAEVAITQSVGVSQATVAVAEEVGVAKTLGLKAALAVAETRGLPAPLALT